MTSVPAGSLSLSTHVLDATSGRPAAGVLVRLEHRDPDGWSPAGAGQTDADGRLRLDRNAGGGPPGGRVEDVRGERYGPGRHARHGSSNFASRSRVIFSSSSRTTARSASWPWPSRARSWPSMSWPDRPVAQIKNTWPNRSS